MDSEPRLIKGNPEDLCAMLKAGKLDAVFLTINLELDIDNIFSTYFTYTDIEKIHICFDGDMYLGISDKYLPGLDSAPFSAFKDFTFALPFRNTGEMSDCTSLNHFESYAKECGFQLKSMFLGRHDNALFQLAATKPVAISTTDVFGSYPGIKFVRIEDWPGGVNEYFLYSANNQKRTLKRLKEHVQRFVAEKNA